MKRLKFLIVTLGLFMACGGSNNQNATSDASNGGHAGGSDKTSFSGTFQTQNGTENIKNTSDRPIKDKFAAAISGQMLSIFILAKDTTLISANIITDENRKLPGGFTTDGQNVTVNLTSPEGSYMGTGKGKIIINSCPKNIGDRVDGRFDHLELKNEGTGQTMEINGDWTVYVEAVSSPALKCSSQGGNNSGNNNNGKCDFDPQKTGCTGPCCPYLNCLGQCITTECISQCMTGQNNIQCIKCMDNCDTDCQKKHMTPECKSKLDTLKSCMDENGCKTLATDEGLQCAEDHCCDQLNDAFIKK